MKLGKVLYDLTGFTTRNYRMELSTKLGKDLAKKIAQGEKVTNADISQLLKENLSKRNFNKVTVIGDKTEVKNFLKEMGYDEETINSFDNSSGSMWTFSGKNGKMMILTGAEGFQERGDVALVAHEFEHLFTQQTSLREKLLNNIFPKIAEKRQQKYGPKAQKMYGTLYDKVISMVKRGDKSGTEKEISEELRKCIRQDVLLPNCDKDNAKILNELRIIFRDEGRAYGVQYNVSKGSVYDKVSKVMTLASDVLKEEVSNQRWNNFRRLIGLKPKEYKIVKPKLEEVKREVETDREEVIRMIKENHVDKKDIPDLMKTYNITESELK